ncbi:MAG: hypothetical protein D6758_01510 [Gammaproteobacteria bacterium]|nr:MAG: hypothetical protein D6758_01510 [Gammaproteobacteria bacterium]
MARRNPAGMGHGHHHGPCRESTRRRYLGQSGDRRFCKVSDITLQRTAIEPLAANVHRARFSIPEALTWQAGQYLQLKVPGVADAFFSIACAPGRGELELHIEAHPEQTRACAVMDWLRQHDQVQALLPLGRCYLPELPEGEVVLAVAGTGFSQAKAICEDLFARGFEHPVTLYWGGRTLEDLYWKALPEQWQSAHTNFAFVPLAEGAIEGAWEGHHAALISAMRCDRHDWPRASLVACGSPNLAYGVLDAAAACGLSEARFYSDVLEYAPRG